MWGWAICFSSVENGLFKSFVCILIGLFVCLKLSCNSSLYSGYKSLNTYMIFKYFLHFRESYFYFFMSSFETQKICILMIFLKIFWFVVLSQKSLPDLRSWRFMPVFSSETDFLHISSYIEDFDPLWVKFYMWREIVVQLYSFACGCAGVPGDVWLLVRKVEEAGGVGSAWRMSWWRVIAASVNV